MRNIGTRLGLAVAAIITVLFALASPALAAPDRDLPDPVGYLDTAAEVDVAAEVAVDAAVDADAGVECGSYECEVDPGDLTADADVDVDADIYVELCIYLDLLVGGFAHTY